jgi:DNA repair protein RadD
VFTLRDDQKIFVSLIQASFRAGHRRVLAQAPTGFGKGVVIANRVAAAAAKCRRLLVIAHREEIISDLSGRIHRYGIPHGIIARDYRMDLNQRVQVASIDTLIRRLDQIPPPDGIITDEAHHLVLGNKWAKPVERWPRAFLLGFTATPERLSGEGLGEGHGGYFQDLILGPSPSWLTYSGHEWHGLTSPGGLLSPLRVFLPRQIDLSSIPAGKRDTAQGLEQAGEILRRRQHMGDVIGHYRRTIAPHHMGTALCYASSLRHAGSLCESFLDAGIPAIVIDGNTDKKIRRDAFRDLGDGSLKVLINRDIAGEGTDVPSVTGVIIDRQTASLALHFQMLGRALRIAPGKEFAVCNDHVGNVGDSLGNTRLGVPTDPHEWSLEGRKKRQGADVTAEPHRTCPTCFARVPTRLAECFDCGFIFPPPLPPQQLEHVEGDLVEYNPEAAAAARAQAAARRQRIQQERDCRTLEDFQALGQQRGYNPGWAYHRWKLREQRRNHGQDRQTIAAL